MGLKISGRTGQTKSHHSFYFITFQNFVMSTTHHLRNKLQLNECHSRGGGSPVKETWIALKLHYVPCLRRNDVEGKQE